MTAVIPKHLVIFHKARRLCIILGGIYIFLVLLGATPFAQAQLLFMHNLKRPFFAQYDMPEKYDLAPFKTHNVRIQTADNETLGAWFTLSDPFYATHKPLLLNDAPTNLSSLASTSLSSLDDLIPTALRTHPTILFLHGTTGTRVVPSRVRMYQAFAARLRANVLALDYRGFADSTGTPSESGLTLDTRAAWDWLRTNGASPDNVLVVGDSLGTGVAVQFASALEEETSRSEAEARAAISRQKRGDKKMWAPAMIRERPRGVVLFSPFSKLETLLDTYHILGLVPLFAPLRVIPYLANFVKGFMVHRFDSLAKVVGLKAPLLIVHAEDDQDIPFWHAQMLFDACVEKHLPQGEPEMVTEVMTMNASVAGELKRNFGALLQRRAVRRDDLVTVREMERVGRVEVFSRNRPDGKVAYLQTRWGKHNVGSIEGVQDYMAEMFNMG